MARAPHEEEMSGEPEALDRIKRAGETIGHATESPGDSSSGVQLSATPVANSTLAPAVYISSERLQFGVI